VSLSAVIEITKITAQTSAGTTTRAKPRRKIKPLPARVRKETPSPTNTVTDIEDENPDDFVSGLGRSLSVIQLDDNSVCREFIYLLGVV